MSPYFKEFDCVFLLFVGPAVNWNVFIFRDGPVRRKRNEAGICSVGLASTLRFETSNLGREKAKFTNF
jgi:hypothetical protein